MGAGSTAPPCTKQYARSKISNGSSLFLLDNNGHTIDGRTTLARRFRDLYDAIIADLGGLDMLSEGEKQLARRVAGLSVWGEYQETLLAAQSSEFDFEQYVSLVNGLGRALSRIGLKRRQKPVQSLEQYVDGLQDQAPTS